MAKKRTKAQRSAAAKEVWAKRKLQSAYKPTPVDWPVIEVGREPHKEVVYVSPPPKLGYAVREGNDIFLCFGEDGSLRRERVSLELAKKVYLDLAKLVV